MYFSSHVLSEDTVSRLVIDGKLHSTRLITKTNSLPAWGKKLINAKKVYLIEHSIVDAKEKLIHTSTFNVGLTKVGDLVVRY